MASTSTATTAAAALHPDPTDPALPIGDKLRAWRQRRRLSQLDLALDAEISQRHLSFVESGRASPSRDMVLRLAATLEVPLRERNALLLAAGYAPLYREQPLDAPAMGSAHDAVERILRAHMPHPALAVDRHWHMVAANEAVPPLMADVAEPALLAPPVNVMRLSLHPQGVAPRIANLPQWRAHLLERLRRQVAASGDRVLAALLAEVRAFGTGLAEERGAETADGVAVPLELNTPRGRMCFLSTTMVFGTPTEVTLSELAIEAFYPADAETAALLAGR